MVGLEPSSPPKTCTCGAFSAGTPPGRGVTKSPRITGAGNPPGKSPSTPKSSQRPGSATTPKTPGSKQCNGVQPIQKVITSIMQMVSNELISIIAFILNLNLPKCKKIP